MYWQSSGLKPRFWFTGKRGFFIHGGRRIKMAEKQESPAVRNANKHFRKEEQAKASADAWREYREQEDATRLKTARLRAERLAREAAALRTAVPSRRAPRAR